MAAPPPSPKPPASAKRDDLLDDDDLDELEGRPTGRNPHASATRWRHQESSAFARHAAAHPQARDAEARGRTNDLADFLNSTRIGPAPAAGESGPQPAPDSSGSRASPRFTPIVVGAAEAREATGKDDNDGEPHAVAAAEGPVDGKEVACGPLLNYRRMERGRWLGSVLVVTRGGGKTQPFVPKLLIRPFSGKAATTSPAEDDQGTPVKAFCLYSDPRNTFWRFNLDVPVQDAEARWEYWFPELRYHSKTKPQRSVFNVPAASESMRIMFHSCNGFSVGTDEEAWSGPALWNDVLRVHEKRPFHVMIGGGDQIYNDGIRVSGPLRKWTAISNPTKRQKHPYPESLRQECDDYYLKNYIRWYSVFPFANANGQIPQLNIWDDHDIIDGFGSYVNEFMKCDVFRGIGGTAHKYYLLFQHHLPPPASTYTSDAPVTADPSPNGEAKDPNQLMDTYVADRMTESQYIEGSHPGPYVAEHSYNMYARLGARIAFLGIDARTERTRHQINYPETYDLIFDRVRRELGAAAREGTPIRHLILLLGIPIAYPRLTWLENVFSSPFIGPIKFLNRRFGLGGSFFNHFDGSVDLLDDLDDHYTARTHKKERNQLIERLQTVCAEFSVRITILGGDVHLAAFGRFYSNPKLGIPVENDHRYMANVISSAIVNKPPPAAIANLLSRRNRIHHLNHDTDETLLKLFNKDPGSGTRTASHNNVTMPSRNFAMLTENSPSNQNGVSSQTPTGWPESTSAATQEQHLAPPPASSQAANGVGNGSNASSDHLAVPGSSAGASSHNTSGASSLRSHVPGKNGHYPISAGEAGAGTTHKAAGPQHGLGGDGGLDVCIRVEIDNSDREGHTEAYGLTIPLLRHDPQDPVHARSLGTTGQTTTTTDTTTATSPPEGEARAGTGATAS